MNAKATYKVNPYNSTGGSNRIIELEINRITTRFIDYQADNIYCKASQMWRFCLVYGFKDIVLIVFIIFTVFFMLCCHLLLCVMPGQIANSERCLTLLSHKNHLHGSLLILTPYHFELIQRPLDLEKLQ